MDGWSANRAVKVSDIHHLDRSVDEKGGNPMLWF